MDEQQEASNEQTGSSNGQIHYYYNNCNVSYNPMITNKGSFNDLSQRSSSSQDLKAENISAASMGPSTSGDSGPTNTFSNENVMSESNEMHPANPPSSTVVGTYNTGTLTQNQDRCNNMIGHRLDTACVPNVTRSDGDALHDQTSEVTSSNNQFERMPENSMSKIGSTTASEKPCQTFTDIFTVDENGDSPEESNASIPKETDSSATSQPPSTPEATSNTAAFQTNGRYVTMNHDKTPTFVAPTPDIINAGIKELETSAEQQTGTSEHLSKASQEPSTEEKTVLATKRMAADDGSDEPGGGSHPRTKIPKTDGNSSNEPGDTKKGSTRRPQNKKCNPSTLKDFTNYATKGRIKILGNLSTLKPHIIMSNLEKFIYEDNTEEANAQRMTFFKQIEFQSSPSAEDLDELVKQIPQNKNPVRAALFHTAAAFQHIQDNAKVGIRSYAVSGCIYQIFDLVLKLTSGRKSAKEVLDFVHLKNGAQAKKIAKVLVPFMQKLYEVGCAEDNEGEQTSRKAYALRWIAAALYQIEKYEEAIELLDKRSAHYSGVQNESEVNICQTLALCYEKKKRFADALIQMNKALSLANTVEMKDKENTIKYLEIHITRIQTRI